MIIEIIANNVYTFLLALSITEGPVTAFIAAWLAAQWILELSYVIIIVIIGDIIWDILRYAVGRYSHKLKFLSKFHEFTEQKNFLSKRMKKSLFIYLFIIKFTPLLAVPSIIFAWVKKVKFWKFILYSTIISIFIKASYLLLGYLGSVSIRQMSNILDDSKLIVLYVLGGIFLLRWIRKLYKYIGKRIRKDLEKE